MLDQLGGHDQAGALQWARLAGTMTATGGRQPLPEKGWRRSWCDGDAAAPASRLGAASLVVGRDAAPPSRVRSGTGRPRRASRRYARKRKRPDAPAGHAE